MKLYGLKQKIVLLYDLLRLSNLTGSINTSYNYLRQNHPLDQIICSFQGLRFHARRSDWPVLREVFLNGEYSCLQKIFTSNESPRIIDFGAHIGSFALAMFAHTRTAHIYSMEAAQDTAAILEKNIELNPSFDWHIIRGAIWSGNDLIYLNRSQSSLGHQVGARDTGEPVEAFTPDEVLAKVGWDNIDLIKMDIEGAEGEVVPKAEQLFARARYLLIEIHNDRINGDAVFAELGRQFGYIYRLGGRWSGKPVFLFSKTKVGSLSGWQKI